MPACDTITIEGEVTDESRFEVSNVNVVDEGGGQVTVEITTEHIIVSGDPGFRSATLSLTMNGTEIQRFDSVPIDGGGAGADQVTVQDVADGSHEFCCEVV